MPTKSKLFLSGHRWPKYAGDLFIIGGCYYLAFLLRFDGYIVPVYYQIFLKSLPLILLAKVIMLSQYHLYSYFWRYTSLRELLGLTKALSLASLCIVTAYGLTTGFLGFPRSVFVLDWGLSLAALGIFRILPRVMKEKTLSLEGRPSTGSVAGPDRVDKMLLYGAGDLGATVAKQIQETYGPNKKILGFIDDDPLRQDMRIHDVPVLGGRSKLMEIAAEQRIDEILVTVSSLSGAELKELVSYCRRFATSVQTAPSLNELFLGKVRISDFREFQIEDLLGREPVRFSEALLRDFLADKCVLVTGGGGSIGSEICFQVLKFNPQKVLMLGKGENSIHEAHLRLVPFAKEKQLEVAIADVTNIRKLDNIFCRFRPNVVFHAAAAKHVPLMEQDPDEAVFNNVIGTQNVLRVADKYGVERLVSISTDKAVNPVNVMGCCKRVTELMVQEGGLEKTVCCSVRFGNVLGSRGSVVPTFKKQISDGGPVTVTDPDIERYFMTISEAVLLVLQAGAICRGQEVFVLDMGEPMRIIDLARQMIRLTGLGEERIPIHVSGVRPGEKLHEELTFSFEETKETIVPKLYRLVGKASPSGYLQEQIEELRRRALKMDFAGIQSLLCEIVPEYDPLTTYPEETAAVKPGSVG